MGGGRRRFVGFLIPFILLWTFYTVSQRYLWMMPTRSRATMFVAKQAMR
jgi:hypothetical protein